ncbi:MAG: hypothetical protein ACRCS9_08765 [Hyphomicrobium sp.]
MPTLARYWRVLVRGAGGCGALSLSGLRFWHEKAEISPVRVFPVDRSADVSYDLILTERNVDVFKRGASGARRYVASIPVPVAHHQIDQIAVFSSRDTVFLFHEDIPSIRIVRQGSDVEWNVDTLPAYNVPALQAGTAFGGDQDEVADITFPAHSVGQSYVFFVGDLVTAPVTYADVSQFAADIAAAIDALPGLAAPAITTQSLTPLTLRVAFVGANGSRAWPALTAIRKGDDGAAPPVQSQVQAGLASSGPYFGARTGWPRCGCTTQGRLLLAGFRASPHSWAASAIDDFDFKNDPGPADDSVAGAIAPPLTADMAFVRTLDTDQIETIQQVFVGRNLQFFTDSSEWYVESRTLDATQPPNAVRATGVGIKSSVRATFAEGATIVVQQGGRTVRDFLFNDVEQSYKAEPLTLLSPHLFENVIDVAFRKALTTDEANLLFFINANGSRVCLSLLRSQEVVACVLHTTPAGSYRAVAAHANGDVLFIVERAAAGVSDNIIEMRSDTPLDSAVRRFYDTPQTNITSLSHLDGRTVWAYAGSELCGPFVVAFGEITLAAADAATDVTVGLFPEVSGALQKVREPANQQPPFRLPGRIFAAGFALKDTGQLQIRTNGSAWRELVMTFHDGGPADPGQLTPADYRPELPLLDRLMTGEIEVNNLRGWSKHPQLEFRQTVPAPLHIKAIRLEIAGKG